MMIKLRGHNKKLNLYFEKKTNEILNKKVITFGRKERVLSWTLYGKSSRMGLGHLPFS